MFLLIWSNISKIFWKASTKFQSVFCKIYTHFIHNLPEFLENFLKDYQNFFKISTNISQNEYFFLIYVPFSRQFPSPLLAFYHVSSKFLKFFFEDLLKVSVKLQLKFDQIFILVYLKIFLQVSEALLNFSFDA